MHAVKLIVSLVGLAIIVSVPSRADPTPPDPSGRYTMSPTDEGVVRLDTHTGAMALCQRKDGVWACEDMGDSQRALVGELDKLKAENKSLRDEVEHLEETLGLNAQAGAPSPRTKLALPSEEDVDKAFDYLERMLNKLQDRMEKLEKKQGSKPETAL